MFFVLLLQSDDGDANQHAYQVTEHDAGQAPVVFSADTLADCISWLESEGGQTWESQKTKICWITMKIGAAAMWHFQEALHQPTGFATYETTTAQYPELDLVSYDHTRRLLNGWSYNTLKLIENGLDHAYDQMLEANGAEWEEELELTEQSAKQPPSQTKTKAQARTRKPYCKPLKRKKSDLYPPLPLTPHPRAHQRANDTPQPCNPTHQPKRKHKRIPNHDRTALPHHRVSQSQGTAHRNAR